MTINRRTFVRASGVGLLAFQVGGVTALLLPAEARSQGLAYRVLGKTEVEMLEALCETLLPGSVEAGVAHFVDHQLANPLREIKLTVRYLSGVIPPYERFYQQGLAAIESASKLMFERSFRVLELKDKSELIRRLITGEVEGWSGPASRQFYLALKSDAVDVVYGTQEGIESLGMPYMPHLVPPQKW